MNKNDTEFQHTLERARYNARYFGFPYEITRTAQGSWHAQRALPGHLVYALIQPDGSFEQSHTETTVELLEAQRRRRG